jgi:hypothetical protein
MTARIGAVPAGGAPYPLLRGLRSAGLVTFGPAEDRARRSTMEMKASEGSGAMTMRAVVVYESMYGNTHLIADAIGAGLGTVFDVRVVPVSEASAAVLDGADLVVVGGPTHAHGMSRAGTRKAAVEAADKPASPLKVEPDALGPGLRDWFGSLGQYRVKAAAFDTRIHGPAALTGRASKGVARLLRAHGFEMVAGPESFLVTKQDRLDPQETTRARDWGATLAAGIVPSRVQGARS